MNDKLNILIICEFDCLHIGTINDHINAFKKYSNNNICNVDAYSLLYSKLDVNLFDVLVIHYSIISDAFLNENIRKNIKKFRGYKVLFIQDEYRCVNDTANSIEELNINVVYSVINKEIVNSIYHLDKFINTRFLHTLTGFVPERLVKMEVPKYQNRSIDIGYRARKVPYWLGYFAQEKFLIGERFKNEVENYNLICDISHEEDKRHYGHNWITFLSNCKAVLGTESGASYIDFDGNIQKAVESYLADNQNASFEEISQKFLSENDGKYIIHVISPRCFEAAALRTLMVLYPGDYSGILKPWQHYVPLKRDHSNINEVVEYIQNPEKAIPIIDRAYKEVALNPLYSYRNMVNQFDDDLSIHVKPDAIITKNQIKFIEAKNKLAYFIYRVFIRKIFITHEAIHWLIKILIPKHLQPVTVNYLRIFIRRIKSS